MDAIGTGRNTKVSGYGWRRFVIPNSFVFFIFFTFYCQYYWQTFFFM